MRNKQIESGAQCTVGTGIENLSEVDALLSQLLSQPNEVLEFAPICIESIPYNEIRRVRVNGIRAVQLPDGTLLARALDKKSGNIFWMRVRA
jgi:hypothetical protein